MTAPSPPTELDELGVAKTIRDGLLPSPQWFKNVLLIALRITGTGLAYRTAHDEFVWRDPSLYLNDEFLERCQGLPVILGHPERNVLNSAEFANRVIGTITLPYVRGDEIWALARIYDIDAAERLANENLSTSPCVVFSGLDGGGVRRSMGNGSMILIEGKPQLLDHLAIVDRGVWDFGGPPSGVARGRVDQILHRLESGG